jgi:MFS family permease
MSEVIAWTTIFPYIYAMIQSFSTEHDTNTAIYAGRMVSVFTLGEFLMAPQWAKISNRVGRKSTLLIGSVGTIFSALVFGFSSSLPMAIGARVCAGILYPNLGVLQTFVGEINK